MLQMQGLYLQHLQQQAVECTGNKAQTNSCAEFDYRSVKRVVVCFNSLNRTIIDFLSLSERQCILPPVAEDAADAGSVPASSSAGGNAIIQTNSWQSIIRQIPAPKIDYRSVKMQGCRLFQLC